MGLYELWKNFDEKKEMGAILAKMPRPQLQDPNVQQQQQMQRHN